MSIDRIRRRDGGPHAPSAATPVDESVASPLFRAAQQRRGAQRRGERSAGALPIAESGGELPHRAEMETAFGEDLGDVRASVGQKRLGRLGADAAAAGEQVAFAAAQPSKEAVAHEVAHVVQGRRHGAPSGGKLSRGDEPAETEAHALAPAAAAGRPVRVGAALTAGIHLRHDPKMRVKVNAPEKPHHGREGTVIEVKHPRYVVDFGDGTAEFEDGELQDLIEPIEPRAPAASGDGGEHGGKAAADEGKAPAAEGKAPAAEDKGKAPAEDKGKAPAAESGKREGEKPIGSLQEASAFITGLPKGLMSQPKIMALARRATTAEAKLILQATPHDSINTLLEGLMQARESIGPFREAAIAIEKEQPDLQGPTFMLCESLRLGVHLNVPPAQQKRTKKNQRLDEAWDPASIKRVEAVLKTLPAEHLMTFHRLVRREVRPPSHSILEKILCCCAGPEAPEPTAEGESATGTINLMFNKESFGATEHPQATDDDPMQEIQSQFDHTLRHEVGHNVGDKIGATGAYCKTEAGGGWETYSTVNHMVDDLMKHGRADLEGLDQEAVKDVLTALANKERPRDQQTFARLKDKPIVRELQRANEEPWWQNEQEVLDGRVFHNDRNSWYSYAAQARERKVSLYQFRSPAEWFAEAYAAFYEPSAVKGERLQKVDPVSWAYFSTRVDPGFGDKRGEARKKEAQNDVKDFQGPLDAAATPRRQPPNAEQLRALEQMIKTKLEGGDDAPPLEAAPPSGKDDEAAAGTS
jgi:hypothetical protein